MFVKKKLIRGALFLAVTALLTTAVSIKRVAADDGPNPFFHFQFQPGTLVLSRSVYVGTPSMLVPGVTVLPPNCVGGTVSVDLVAGGTTTATIPTGNGSGGCSTATADGTFPYVFNNAVSDGNFGITSPIFLDDISTDGWYLGTLPIPTNQIVTSFSSKSELAVHRSTDGKSITFIGYVGGPGYPTGPNLFDVSNSNTPGVIDPSNPVSSQYFRSVAEVDAHGNITITNGNAYSGDNGRSVIKGGGFYYMAGNDNNGNLSKKQLTTTVPGVQLITSTGAEFLVPGQEPPPVPPNVNMIGDFSVTSICETTVVSGKQTKTCFPADKAGKDNNFRGITIFDNTLYVTKGSGGNGINTIYQVGTAGTLPTGTTAQLEATPITIPSGFPATLASGVDLNGNPAPVYYPFGIWFANANTLYVCDEGDGTLVSPPVNGNVATTYSQTTSGVQKWVLQNGTWNMVYVINNGLNIGVPYGVPFYPTALNPATDGCRGITGKVNRDGTVEIYAVTSTVSPSGDQGADPNKLVKAIDVLDATSLPSPNNPFSFFLDRFFTLRTARFGEVFRGVDFAPEDNPNFGDY